MTGVCMDISGRKRTEEGIAEALRQEATTRERLTELTRGAQRLLTSLDRASVLEAVLDLAEAVSRPTRTRCGGCTTGCGGCRRPRPERRFRSHVVAPQPPGAVRMPIVAEDVTRRSSSNTDSSTRSRGSSGSCPYRWRCAATLPGSITLLLSPTPPAHRYRAARGHGAGKLAAAAIANADLYEEQQRLRRDAEDAEIVAAFLAEASAVLSSLDYEQNLQRVAELAVPRLSDWCAVDFLTDQGTIERLVITHADPE